MFSMLAWTLTEQITIVVIVWFGFNLISAFRVLAQFRRMGRRRAAFFWFIITLLFSAIPYLALGIYYRARWIIKGDEGDNEDASADAPRRCPHCQALLTADDTQPPGRPKTCSRCGMALREDDVA